MLAERLGWEELRALFFREGAARQAIQECNPGGNHRVIRNVTRGVA